MIKHLSKEEDRIWRRLLLRDDVFIIFSKFLKEQHDAKVTSLSRAELYLSALNLAMILCNLPDIEGVSDELDDLEDEAETEADALFISILTVAIVHAVAKNFDSIDDKGIKLCILTRWMEHELFKKMLDAGQEKESARWHNHQKTNLQSCRLEVLQGLGEVDAAVLAFINEFVDATIHKGEQVIVPVLLVLYKLNLVHNNAFAEFLNRLDKSLEKPLLENVTVNGDYVVNKQVANEVNGVGENGVGIKVIKG